MTQDEPSTANANDQAPTSDLSGSLTEIVTLVVGPAGEAARAQRPNDADEIHAITDAMVRLLAGVPLRSDGQLTIKSLAEEANLKRNKLTHKHTGLKELFYALVQVQHVRPRNDEQLHQDRDELTAKLKNARQELGELSEEIKRLVRIVHVLEVENDQLTTATGRSSKVRVLPQR